jgi:magnesium-transporting ATPase (P-type)
VLALCYKDLQVDEGGPDNDEMAADGVNRSVETGNFILVALIGIRDVLRDDVEEAIGKC